MKFLKENKIMTLLTVITIITVNTLVSAHISECERRDLLLEVERLGFATIESEATVESLKRDLPRLRAKAAERDHDYIAAWKQREQQVWCEWRRLHAPIENEANAYARLKFLWAEAIKKAMSR